MENKTIRPTDDCLMLVGNYLQFGLVRVSMLIRFDHKDAHCWNGLRGTIVTEGTVLCKIDHGVIGIGINEGLFLFKVVDPVVEELRQGG
jgi:hypothetical protein